MTIGIIGAGTLGMSLAKALANRKLPAQISNGRGPGTLAELVRQLGPPIEAVSRDEAAKADIVVLAVRWGDVRDAVEGVVDWDGRIVIDATNPLDVIDPDSPDAADPNNLLAPFGIKAIDIGSRASSEIVSDLVPGAKVVKAFNHAEAELLIEPQAGGGKRVLFYSGDDDAAKSEVRNLIEQLGMFPVDLGKLSVGCALATMPFGSLATTNFIKI